MNMENSMKTGKTIKIRKHTYTYNTLNIAEKKYIKIKYIPLNNL